MYYDREDSKSIGRLKERLQEGQNWFPYPALISFFFVVVFIAHLIPSLNSRFGSPAKLINYSATPEPEGSLWLSIYPSEGKIFIKTMDRKTFNWSLAKPAKEDVSKFVKYLKKTTEKVHLSAGITNEVDLIKASAVISTDHNLNYYHVQPVLYALAEAGITNYGFETINSTH